MVILPAFGVTVHELQRLSDLGCTLVDTTCGSVLNVWKNVSRYANDGLTSVIHGKYWHEETRATASQALRGKGGHYLVVFDKAEAADRVRLHPRRAARALSVPGAIRAMPCRRGSILSSLATGRLRQPDHDAQHRIDRDRRDVPGGNARRGTATTSCPPGSGRSIRSAARPRIARTPSYRLLAEETLDLMLVIGGYNSSNTCNLARICADKVPTYHIADPSGLISPD